MRFERIYLSHSTEEALNQFLNVLDVIKGKSPPGLSVYPVLIVNESGLLKCKYVIRVYGGEVNKNRDI